MLNSQNKFFRYVLQAFNYSVFMAVIWYLSTGPEVHQLKKDEAVLMISFSHAGKLKEPCTKLSYEELMSLPANMRVPMSCPRERSPVIIEARLDGDLMFNQTVEAAGIFKDGGVDIYHSIKVSAGMHHIEIKMDDSIRDQGFNYSLDEDVEIAPAKILLVGFMADRGFVIK